MARALWLLTASLLAVAAPGAAAPAERPIPAPQCPDFKEVCVQAERSGGIDLKTGIAKLEGNVVGVVRSRGLAFASQRLTAYRDDRAEGEQWQRLVLDEDVRLEQEGSSTHSDHGVLEQQRIRLQGHVRIEQAELVIRADRAVLEAEPHRRTTVQGSDERPLEIVMERRLLSAPGAEAGAAPAATGAAGNGGPEDAPVSTRLRAREAVLDEGAHEVQLIGGVDIAQLDEGLHMEADAVTLRFDAASTLLGFRARGDVRIAQPGRTVSADFAESRNGLHTIVLVGRARLRQQGEFALKSDRMEVYTDARRGLLESEDRQKPITLSMELGKGASYGLDADKLERLAGQGVPQATVDKLVPLRGARYGSREAFEEALRARLGPEEAAAYLDTIVAAAR